MVDTGKPAPELIVDGWLQGTPTTLKELKGKYVFLHMFQVNCPGCFGASLPNVEELHRLYGPRGLEVMGLAVRFEEYEVNTRENFEQFLKYGKLTPLVLTALREAGGEKAGFLDANGIYQFKLKHKIAWDKGGPNSYSETFKIYKPKNPLAGYGTPYEFIIDPEGLILDYGFHLSQDKALRDFLDEQLSK